MRVSAPERVGKAMSPASPCLYVEDERQQRWPVPADVANTIPRLLRDDRQSRAEDNVRKFEDVFERRAANGQCFRVLTLGCREFGADFRVGHRY